MPNNLYVELMTREFEAHKEFHRVFKEYLNDGGMNKPEPPEVTDSRNTYFREQNRLWNTLLYPLQVKFDSKTPEAIDEIIDFLEVDIPAFRSGYLKEHFLKKLKRVELTQHQKDRLLKIGLELCKNNIVRREFRRWINLISRIADKKFILGLETMLESNKHAFAARIMLEGVLNKKNV